MISASYHCARNTSGGGKERVGSSMALVKDQSPRCIIAPPGEIPLGLFLSLFLSFPFDIIEWGCLLREREREREREGEREREERRGEIFLWN